MISIVNLIKWIRLIVWRCICYVCVCVCACVIVCVCVCFRARTIDIDCVTKCWYREYQGCLLSAQPRHNYLELVPISYHISLIRMCICFYNLWHDVMKFFLHWSMFSQQIYFFFSFNISRVRHKPSTATIFTTAHIQVGSVPWDWYFIEKIKCHIDHAWRGHGGGQNTLERHCIVIFQCVYCTF